MKAGTQGLAELGIESLYRRDFPTRYSVVAEEVLASAIGS